MTVELGHNYGIWSGWVPGDDGWGADMNINLRNLDGTLQFSTPVAPLNAPPGSPALGDRYIVGTAGSGAWAGHNNALAVYQKDEANVSGWQFYGAKEGFRVSRLDAVGSVPAETYLFRGGAWGIKPEVTSLLGLTGSIDVNGLLAAGLAARVGTLDTSGANIGRVPFSLLPSALSEAWYFAGTWDASTNTPTLVSATLPAGQTPGATYVVSVAGTTSIDGDAQWNVGDKIVFNGLSNLWQRIEGDSKEVNSVAGMVGAVVFPAGVMVSNGTTVAAATMGPGVSLTAGTIANTGVLSLRSGTVDTTGTLTMSANFTINAGTVELANALTVGTVQAAGLLWTLRNDIGALDLGAGPTTVNSSTMLQLLGARNFPTYHDIASYGTGNGSYVRLQRAGGSRSAPLNVPALTKIGGLRAEGFDGTAWTNNGPGQLFFSSVSAWTTIDHGTTMTIALAPAGGVNPTTAMTLSNSVATFTAGTMTLNGFGVPTKDSNGYVPFSQMQPEMQNFPVGVSHAGLLADAELVMIIPINESLTLPIGLVGTYLRFNDSVADVPAATATFVVGTSHLNVWTNRGTLSVATTGTLSVVSGPTVDISLVAGDALRVVAQATHDTGMKNFGLVMMLKKVAG